MSDEDPFDISKLVARSSDPDPDEVEKVDKAAERQGFVDRAPQPIKPTKKRRRPRSGQLGNPKVYPEYAVAILGEAKDLGLTNGQFFEELWRCYCDREGREHPQAIE